MKNVQNDRKHLSSRQIINRFKKGEYVDESIEAISAAISSYSGTLEGKAVPFPTSIIEKVFENVGFARDIYDLKKAGKDIDAVQVPYYPQLREILIDLSEPELWESMRDENDSSFLDILSKLGLRGRYILDTGSAGYHDVDRYLSSSYKEEIEQTGLCYFSFKLALYLMFRNTQDCRK